MCRLLFCISTHTEAINQFVASVTDRSASSLKEAAIPGQFKFRNYRKLAVNYRTSMSDSALFCGDFANLIIEASSALPEDSDSMMLTQAIHAMERKLDGKVSDIFEFLKECFLETENRSRATVAHASFTVALSKVDTSGRFSSIVVQNNSHFTVDKLRTKAAGVERFFYTATRFAMHSELPTPTRSIVVHNPANYYQTCVRLILERAGYAVGGTVNDDDLMKFLAFHLNTSEMEQKFIANATIANSPEQKITSTSNYVIDMSVR